MSCIVYAHRGASEYKPENTMSSFYFGCHLGANGIETDVRRTRDGVLVLFHDETVIRMTGAEGYVSDYTYEELLRLRLRNQKTNTEDIVVRLEDFLRMFGFRNLHFAIELKEAGTEKEVTDLLDRYGMREKTIITSFGFGCIQRVKQLHPDYRVGFLADEFDSEDIAKMRAIGGEQLCPKATRVTPQKVSVWHALGFDVRAWGVANPELMKKAYACGVNGMTVNFPDLLIRHILTEEGSVEG